MESTHPQGKCKFSMLRIPYLDSHTGGEPTRLVEAGAPDLGSGTVAEQLSRFRNEHDTFRSQVLNEPRGSDVMVGALLVKPADPTCQFGVIYFNNVGYLGMCGHGTIGLVASLSYQGRLQPGTCRIETPVGVVEATLHPGEPAGHMDGAYPNRVSVRNIPASRHLAHVPVEIDGRTIHGDVAWGGNSFFLVQKSDCDLRLANVEALTDFCWRVRQAVNAQGFSEVDHVELFGPPTVPNAHSRNFVLCPGKAYDRSPCGTGTSAKLACLAADGKLAEGETWVQESIIGSTFTGTFRRQGDKVVPTITGSAFVNAESTLLLDDQDPFCWGIRH